ncbi:MAG TPA: FecR family protein [Terracidiphilus sp.]
MRQMADVTTKQAGRSGRWGIVVAALAMSTAGLAARADNGAPAARAVRLSFVQGQVQISQSGQAITSQATANMPLFEGYQVTTGQDGQAEIQFEDGSVARIAPDSGVTLSILRGQGTSGQAEVDLNGGLGYFEFQGGDQAGRINLRFGNAVVTAGGFTVMRVDMDTAPGTLAVFSGNAHMVRGDATALDLHGNESVTLSASDPSQNTLAETVETNSWDQWNADRDQAMEAQSNTQNKATDSFVNSNNPAWSDLNANGDWYNVPGQGYVWSPFAAANAGWDPYGCGQWMWTPQFGYTWVSCYQWGFMPYSCGTWNFYNAFGWGWSPGMGGCSSWWGGGYGYGGYIGPNIGSAPSGYRPVIRPPEVLHPPRGRFPKPILVDREPRHGFGSPLRSANGPVIIAGHSVEPIRSMPGRNNNVQPAHGLANNGGAASRATLVGGETHGPAPIVTDRGPQSRGYAPVPRTSAGGSYQQPRGYEPQPVNRAGSGSYAPPARGYTPPVRSYSPPAARSEPSSNRGGYSGGSYPGGARPSGGSGSYSGGGGGYHGGGAPSGGSYHGGGAPAGGGGGGYHGGGAPAGGGGGGYHGGGAPSGGGGGGGGFHGGGAPAGGGGGGFHGGAAPSGGGAPAGGGHH